MKNSAIDTLSYEYLINRTDSPKLDQVLNKIDELLDNHYNYSTINNAVVQIIDAVNEEIQSAYNEGFRTAVNLIFDARK